jgi:hypothetical protein
MSVGCWSPWMLLDMGLLLVIVIGVRCSPLSVMTVHSLARLKKQGGPAPISVDRYIAWLLTLE